jgi:hypothetical protein
LRHHLNVLRAAQRLALTAAASALAASGLTIIAPKVALAEFEIQESNIEKGRVELEYRGAVHWGIPKAEKEEAGDEDEGGALDTEVDEAPIRQSHDLELEWGATEWLLLTVTLTGDQPLSENFALSAVELETQVELIERKGNGLGLAFQGAYGFATRGGEADEIEFGPIVELASGKALLTLNPLFTSQVGDNRETDGLGFEYGWRAQYNFAKHWGVGAEMFGEIEDLSNAGSFDDQTHSIGPTLFYKLGDDDDNGNGNGNGNGDDDDKKKVGAPPEMEFSLNVGVQFGLTDVTSDTALKFQGTLEF